MTAEEELRDAWAEAHCCDDIGLNQPLAGFISDLQRAREVAETKVARLEAALRAALAIARGEP
jgi:hypothetical protein